MTHYQTLISISTTETMNLGLDANALYSTMAQMHFSILSIHSGRTHDSPIIHHALLINNIFIGIIIILL